MRALWRPPGRVQQRCQRERRHGQRGQILLLLAELPISTWSYAGQDPSIRHIGPMVQDFHAAFGMGEDDEHISVVDADGVALAAIQGLYRRVQEKDARITALEARVAALEQANEADGSSARPSPSGISSNWLLFGGLCLVGVVLRVLAFDGQ